MHNWIREKHTIIHWIDKLAIGYLTIRCHVARVCSGAIDLRISIPHGEDAHAWSVCHYSTHGTSPHNASHIQSNNNEKLYLHVWSGQNKICLCCLLSVRFGFVATATIQKPHDKEWNNDNLMTSFCFVFFWFHVLFCCRCCSCNAWECGCTFMHRALVCMRFNGTKSISSPVPRISCKRWMDRSGMVMRGLPTFVIEKKIATLNALWLIENYYYMQSRESYCGLCSHPASSVGPSPFSLRFFIFVIPNLIVGFTYLDLECVCVESRRSLATHCTHTIKGPRWMQKMSIYALEFICAPSMWEFKPNQKSNRHNEQCFASSWLDLVQL